MKPQPGFGLFVYLFAQIGFKVGLPRRKRDDPADDYTNWAVELYGGLFYAFFHFEKVRRSSFGGPPRTSLQLYYGLGPDSGPRSAIKRHKYFKLW